MKIVNDVLADEFISSNGVSGIWKVQSEQKAKSFEGLMLHSMKQSQKTARLGFSPIHPNISNDTVSNMVKGFSEGSNTTQNIKVVSAALSSEQEMILNESASSLYTRHLFSKATSQLLNADKKPNVTKI